MMYRNGNYSAFYVEGTFLNSNLGAHTKKDFVSYNLLRAWKGQDASFCFNDSHSKNYNVRDGSDWEKTLKPRLRERISQSKNLILFLSSFTKNSKALREEVDFAINKKGLPVIVIYPEFSQESDIINHKGQTFKKQITDLWSNLPIFEKSMIHVPTLHIPMKKITIADALENQNFMVRTKSKPGTYV